MREQQAPTAAETAENGRTAWAALELAADPAAMEALAAGMAVPRRRLNPAALKALREPLDGPDVTLDKDLALRLEVALPVADKANDPRVGEWLERASDLLAEEDPGPTPFLVGELLVAGALAAIQGAPKTSKTWLELELGMAIATGRKAFDRFKVPERGPVILVLEESGRAALHRRLDALTRGNAVRPDELADLHFAANRRVRLDDFEWQNELRRVVAELRPRAVFFDPLARLKHPGRNENAQDEISVLLDFMRLLRDEAPEPCSVVFVHHTGHDGGHLRGSSDLESYWESKITLKRGSGDEGGVYDFAAEHREAEASAAYRFRQAWDVPSESVRLRLTEDERLEEVRARVAAYLEEHPDASANEVAKTLGGNRGEVLKAVAHLRGEETFPASLMGDA
jgi:hypothetical protein